MANSATPYLDIAKAYEQKARQNLANQEAVMQKQLAASKAQTAANYDSAAAGNYVNYMKQQNAMGEQLARQGIRGGASESALARIGNNYALNQGNTAAQRYAAYGALQNTYDTNLANMRQATEENIANNNMALQQSQVQYEDTLAQRAAEEARYREQVERAIRERQEDIAREEDVRNKTWAREDEQLKAANEREDYLRNLAWGREDQQLKDAIAREDYLRNLSWSREDAQLKAANERDDALRKEAWAREDSQLSAANAREDALRQAAWAREDQLTAAANAREDSRYREEVERAMRERQEDIDREAKYRYEDQDIANSRYADEQRWKQTEWDTSRTDKVLEQYAATISRYTDTKSIDKAIKALENSNDPNKTQMIWLLQQRRAEVKGGGSSGGGSSKKKSSGGGGGSSNSKKSNNKKSSSKTPSVSSGAKKVTSIAKSVLKNSKKKVTPTGKVYYK